MQIFQATSKNKSEVLSILDAFTNYVHRVLNNKPDFISNTATSTGGKFFDEVISSSNTAIFLAEDLGKVIGILTINKFIQPRKAQYCAELEEMFVLPEYHGKDVSQKLMESAFAWAKENNIKEIRLESGVELERAHNFYKKCGFKEYAKGFKIKLQP